LENYDRGDRSPDDDPELISEANGLLSGQVPVLAAPGEIDIARSDK